MVETVGSSYIPLNQYQMDNLRNQSVQLRQTEAAVSAETSRQAETDRPSLTKRLLSYPEETASSQSGHFIVFHIHNLKSGTIKMGDIDTKVEQRIKGKSAGGGFKQRSYTLRGQSKTTKTQIALYMPPSVSVQYGSKYADTEISGRAQIGADIISGAMSGGSLGSLISAVIDFDTGSIASLGILKASEALDQIAPGSKALAQISQGRIISSKMELMFEGISRRNFSYTFNFIPKSEKEAQTVDEIIFEFKRAMTPSYGPALLKGRDNSTFLNIPTTFDIKYFYVSDAGTHKENSFLNKISTCFLTNMDVSYGGERYTAYRESETQRKYGGGISGHNGRGTPPQKSQLTLAFQEIEIITQEAIDQGY